MDSFIDNCRGLVIASIFGIFFLIIICFCNMLYCVSEIDTLKKYHSNTCSECGQVLHN